MIDDCGDSTTLCYLVAMEGREAHEIRERVAAAKRRKILARFKRREGESAAQVLQQLEGLRLRSQYPVLEYMVHRECDRVEALCPRAEDHRWPR